MKNILFISNMYPSDDNPSFGVFIKNVEKSISKIGMLNMDPVYIYWKKRTKLKKLISYLIYWTKCYFKIIKNDYDIFYINYLTLSFVPFLFLTKHLKNKIIISHVHGSDLMYHENRNYFIRTFLKIVLEKAVRRTTFFVAPSIYYKMQIIDKFEISEKIIIVYPSGGVNAHKFYNRKNNELKNCLGYVGRLEKEKGVIELMESIHNVCPFYPELKFIIIGSGSLGPYVKKFISDNSLNGKVELIKPVSQEVLSSYYNSIDCLVFPTYRESLGLVAVEAMSCGVAVLGSNIPALREYIRHQENGFLFKIKSKNAIIESINWFYNLRSIDKKKISDNAYNDSLKYNSDAVNNDFTDELLKRIF